MFSFNLFLAFHSFSEFLGATFFQSFVPPVTTNANYNDLREINRRGKKNFFSLMLYSQSLSLFHVLLLPFGPLLLGFSMLYVPVVPVPLDSFGWVTRKQYAPKFKISQSYQMYGYGHSKSLASGLIRKREDDDHNVVTRATATIPTIHQPFQLSAGDEQDFILPSASHISSFKYLGATCWTNLQLYCYCDGDTLEKRLTVPFCNTLHFHSLAFFFCSHRSLSLFLLPQKTMTFD